MKTLSKRLWAVLEWLVLKQYRAARAEVARTNALMEAAEFWHAECEREYVAAIKAYNRGDMVEFGLAKARYCVAKRRLCTDVLNLVGNEMKGVKSS